MRGITLSADEIADAPPEVRRWFEQEIACTVGHLTVPEPAARAPALPSSDYCAEKPNEDAGGCPPAVASEGMDTMDSTKAEEIRNLIATRAYELWENEGQSHGRDLVNWRQAEQEIMSCIGNGGAPAPSVEVAPSQAGPRVRRRAAK